MSAAYYPPANSLAASVCNFFKVNHEEALSVEDIVCKFEVLANDVPDMLLGAVAQGLLISQGQRRQKTYTAGPKLISAEAAAEELEVPQFLPTNKRPLLPDLDLSKLKIETDVPVPTRYAGSGFTRYDPVFAKLTKPGMSVALPAAYQDTVEKARMKYAKRMPTAKYSVRKVSVDQCRVFRIA